MITYCCLKLALKTVSFFKKAELVTELPVITDGNFQLLHSTLTVERPTRCYATRFVLVILMRKANDLHSFMSKERPSEESINGNKLKYNFAKMYKFLYHMLRDAVKRFT